MRLAIASNGTASASLDGRTVFTGLQVLDRVPDNGFAAIGTERD